MKTYTKLPLLQDSAWDRKTWRYYAPIWIKNITDGISNIIRWIPTIYKDRHWDDYYILVILQKKIELQRKCIVDANRHTSVARDNYWMTVTLNLIERVKDDYYSMEQYNYQQLDSEFKNCEDRVSCYTIEYNLVSDTLNDYFTKYKGTVRRVCKERKYDMVVDKQKLAFNVAIHNQQRCRKLLFTILERYSDGWWD